MIVFKSGDLLKGGCDIICHQVNLIGIMGGGLALQIARAYPEIEDKYLEFCEADKQSVGECFIAETDNIRVANCFSQEPNFDTNYEAVRQCFTTVKEYAKTHNLKRVGVPYKYGCGIANGEWLKVMAVFTELFENDDLRLEIYKL